MAVIGQNLDDVALGDPALPALCQHPLELGLECHEAGAAPTRRTRSSTPPVAIRSTASAATTPSGVGPATTRYTLYGRDGNNDLRGSTLVNGSIPNDYASDSVFGGNGNEVRP